MSHTLCILAAGRGSRMGQFQKWTHKSLLPVDGMPVLSHIIRSFSKIQNVVIAISEEGGLIKEYVQHAHPDKVFQWQIVQKNSGVGSGPGQSLWECRQLLNKPFYLSCCDTLWSEPVENMDSESWVGIFPAQPGEDLSRFCMVVGKDYVNAFRDKEPNPDRRDADIFMGLFYIQYPELLFAKEPQELISQEVQLSALLKNYLQRTSLKKQRISTWKEAGTEQDYEKLILGTNALNSSTLTYQVGNRRIIQDQNPQHQFKKIKITPNYWSYEIV